MFMTGAIESRKVRAGSRTYFFDLKQTRTGDKYVVITESRISGEGEEYERQRITIFKDARLEILGVVQYMLGEM